MTSKTITFRPTKANEEYLNRCEKKSEEINLAIEYRIERSSHITMHMKSEDYGQGIEKPTRNVENLWDLPQKDKLVQLQSIVDNVMNKEPSMFVTGDKWDNNKYIKDLRKYQEIMSSKGTIMSVDEYGQTEYFSKDEALKRAGLEDFVPRD